VDNVSRSSQKDEILTVPEVARYLGVHPFTVYRMLRSREIPAFRVGEDWRFHLPTVREWLEKKLSNGNRRWSLSRARSRRALPSGVPSD
jgi:excisionase family DNA binding protein